MAAPKKGPRRHLHIDPYVYLDKGLRVDKALAWYDSQQDNAQDCAGI
jgi:hypothetical protein